MNYNNVKEKERAHFNLAKLKKGGQLFEIDVDPDLAVDFKQGKKVEVRDIIKAQKIFVDVSKGLPASDQILEQVFKTKDPLEIATIILKEGEIQLTSEHRERIREVKRRRIVELIRRNGIDPRTGLPHPLVRIESAFTEAKIRIDEFVPDEKQVPEIMNKLMPILPIKFETKQLEILLEARYASKLHSIVKGYGKLVTDEWRSDGSWRGVIDVPAGMVDELIDKVNAITHGDNQINFSKK